jgi:SnoaL-like domain
MTHLPDVVAQYQDAHDRREVDRALAAFTPNAIVKDDGREYHGDDEIRDWLSKASTQFSYSRTLTGVDAVDANTWLVTNHLEGNFPGGVVDLRYRFVLIDDRISELEIAL